MSSRFLVPNIGRVSTITAFRQSRDLAFLCVCRFNRVVPLVSLRILLGKSLRDDMVLSLGLCLW